MTIVPAKTARPTTSTVLLTPDTAKRWLDANTINRPLNKGAVERYRGDMLAGLWQYTHAGIAFDTNGDLVDGQHRLHAIAGLPEGHAVAMSVTRGLAPESRFYVDQGRKRTPGNQLAMAGVRNFNQTAAGARLYLLWATGNMFRDNNAKSSITAPKIQEWVADNAGLVDLANDSHREIVKNDATPAVARAAFFAFAQVDATDAVEFFHRFSTGIALGAGSPILALRERLASDRRQRVKRSDREQLGLFVKAWNAEREGRQLKRLTPQAWTAQDFPLPV